jgi:hypothetical protein
MEQAGQDAADALHKVSKVVCRKPPRTPLCGKPRHGGGGGAQPHAFTAASTDRGTRTPRVGTDEQTERDRRE